MHYFENRKIQCCRMIQIYKMEVNFVGRQCGMVFPFPTSLIHGTCLGSVADRQPELPAIQHKYKDLCFNTNFM